MKNRLTVIDGYADKGQVECTLSGGVVPKASARGCDGCTSELHVRRDANESYRCQVMLVRSVIVICSLCGNGCQLRESHCGVHEHRVFSSE